MLRTGGLPGEHVLPSGIRLKSVITSLCKSLSEVGKGVAGGVILAESGNRSRNPNLPEECYPNLAAKAKSKQNEGHSRGQKFERALVSPSLSSDFTFEP